MGIRIMITGGAGFIGTLLARRLLAGPAAIPDGAEVAELVVVDLAEPPPDVARDPRVRAVTGDLARVVSDLGRADVVFHLAGVVSGAAEADFDLGMAVNVDGTRAVLEHARRQEGTPVVMNLPALTTTPADMAAAMDRVAGYPASDLIDWAVDPAITAIVASWPARVEARRAHALGLRPDGSFDDIVRDYRQARRIASAYLACYR